MEQDFNLAEMIAGAPGNTFAERVEQVNPLIDRLLNLGNGDVVVVDAIAKSFFMGVSTIWINDEWTEQDGEPVITIALGEDGEKGLVQFNPEKADCFLSAESVLVMALLPRKVEVVE